MLVLGLVIAATKANILDKNGIIAAALLGLIVGLGGWYWLLTLLIFLLTSHKVTKYRFAEKKERGMSESDDGHRGWQNVLANGGLAGLVSIISFCLVLKIWAQDTLYLLVRFRLLQPTHSLAK